MRGALSLAQAIEQQVDDKVFEFTAQGVHVRSLWNKVANNRLRRNEKVEQANQGDVEKQRVDLPQFIAAVAREQIGKRIDGPHVHFALLASHVGGLGIGKFVDHQAMDMFGRPGKARRIANARFQHGHRLGVFLDLRRYVGKHLVDHREKQGFSIAEIITDQRRIHAGLARNQRHGDARGRQVLNKLHRLVEHSLATHSIVGGAALPALLRDSFRHSVAIPLFSAGSKGYGIIPKNRNCVGQSCR